MNYRYLFVALILALLLAACGQPNHNPLNLHTEAGPGFITVSWNNSFSNATSVVVKRAEVTAGGNLLVPFAKIATLAPDATSYQDTNIVAGVSYRYSVGLWQDDRAYRYEQQTGSIQAMLPLKLKDARSTGHTAVVLSFNKRIDPTTVAALNNYQLSPELAVTQADLLENGTEISLTTAPQDDAPYTITLSRRPDSGLKDMAGYGLMADKNTATFAGTGMADTTPPMISELISTSPTTVRLSFNEPVMGLKDSSHFEIHSSGSEVLLVEAATANDSNTQVTLMTATQEDVTYTLSASSIEDSSGNALDLAGSVLSFQGIAPARDTIAPQLIDTLSLNNTTVQVTFSEPVENPENVSFYHIADGSSQALAVTAAKANDFNTEVTLTTTSQAEASYTLTVSNIRDEAGNTIDLAASSATFAGTPFDPDPDTIAPQVVRALSLSNTQVQVIFNEPMLGPEDISYYHIADGSGQVLAVTAAAANDFNTEVILTTASQTDSSYTLTVSNIGDLAGNPIDEAARSAPFAGVPLDPNPDVTAPQIIALVSKGNMSVQLSFDEAVQNPGDASHYQISGPTGTSLVVTSANANSFGTVVTLISHAQQGVRYTLETSGIRDLAGNPLDVVNSQTSFNGTPPPAVDTDGDGLSDKTELEGWTVTITLENGTTETYLVTSNPNLRDSDSDGLGDAEEHALQSDPTSGDTDEDGLGDAAEIRDYDTSLTSQDSDGDKLNDGRELEQGTDPTAKDTDGDGLLDGEEVDGVELHNGNFAILNPRKADTDGDGRNDSEEVEVSCNVSLTPPIEVYSHPEYPDTDGDTLSDSDECNAGTDPTNGDSDGDGVPDNEDGDPFDPKASEDTEKPTLTWIEPTDSGIVKSGNVTLRVQASDNIGVVRVEFFVGSNIIGTDSDPADGFSLPWQSMGYVGQQVILRVVAYDAASNSGNASVTVRVDGGAPKLEWEEPADSSAVRGTVTLTVNAIDNARVARIAFLDGPANSDFLGDGVLTVPDPMGEGRYSFMWDSTQYFDGDVTLRAVVYDGGGNTTQQSITVTVDNTLPELSWNSPAAGAAVKGTVTLSVEATDNLQLERVEFQIGNQTYAATRSGTTNTYTYDWDSSSVSSGSTSITAIAYDAVGNKAGIPRDITVDNQPPELFWRKPANLDIIGGIFTLEVVASDEHGAVESVEFTADGSALTEDVIKSGDTYVTAWDTSSDTDNAAELSATACDMLDNCRTQSINVTTDNTAPTVSWNALEDPFGGTVTLSVTASDNEELASVEFYANDTLIDSVAGAPGQTIYELSWNSSFKFDPGDTINLKAIAVDAAGNQSDADMITATVESDSPTVTWLNPNDSDVVSGDVTLRVEVTDNDDVDYVEFFAEANSLGSVSAPAATDQYALIWNSLSADGVVTLKAVAYDEAGNQTDPPKEITVTVDNSPPELSWNSPAAGAAINGTVTLSVEATDNRAIDHVEFKLNNTTHTASLSTGNTYTYDWNSTSVSSGSTSITAMAYDAVGNQTELPRDIIVDNIPPSLEWNSPEDGDTVGGTVTLSVRDSNGAALYNVSFEVNGTSLTGSIIPQGDAYTLEWNSSGESGDVQLQAFAEDAAGNTGQMGVITVTVDNAAPAPTWESPANGDIVGDIVTLEVSTTGGATGVKFFADDTLLETVTSGAGGSYEYDWNTSSYNDAVSLEAVAFDAVGNEGSAAISVIVDNTEPVLVTWISPTDGGYVNTNNVMTLEVEATDNEAINHVEFSTVEGEALTAIGDDNSASGDNYSVDEVLPGGSTDGDEITLRATVFDDAGYYDSSDITVTVDNTAPTVTLTGPSEPVSGTITLSVEATDIAGDVDRVEFEIGGTTYSATQSSSDPDIYEYEWDSTAFGEEDVIIKATAYDRANNFASHNITVTVDNTAPSVTLTDPGDVSGTVTLSVEATDGGGIKSVEIEIQIEGDTLTYSATQSSSNPDLYEYEWDSTGYGTTGYDPANITATAYDTAGNSASDDVPTVAVNNAGP